MLAHALEAEVHVFLGRDRSAPGGPETGYRNGHGRPREIGIGTWSVQVRPPRVSDLPLGVPRHPDPWFNIDDNDEIGSPAL